jgi:Domain of unknown function (DUF4440)
MVRSSSGKRIARARQARARSWTNHLVTLMMPSLSHAAVALLLACAAPVQALSAAPIAASDTADVVAAQRAWWRAFTLADTAYLREHLAPAASLTLSSGRTLGRDAILSEAASFTTGAQLAVTWVEETVRFPAPAVAIVTSRVSETAGPVTGVYRYLTVLERQGAGWRVTLAQTTREAAFTPRAYAAATSQLGDFVGAYRTPRGLTLRIAASDSALKMIEPSGKELRLEPVGPGLFELSALSPANGVVRLLFTRDASGRVTSLSQLAPGAVNTFPRIP